MRDPSWASRARAIGAKNSFVASRGGVPGGTIASLKAAGWPPNARLPIGELRYPHLNSALGGNPLPFPIPRTLEEGAEKSKDVMETAFQKGQTGAIAILAGRDGAIAASIAFPPADNTSRPTRAARGSSTATPPKNPSTPPSSYVFSCCWIENISSAEDNTLSVADKKPSVDETMLAQPENKIVRIETTIL